jgi:hypothetical protein
LSHSDKRIKRGLEGLVSDLKDIVNLVKVQESDKELWGNNLRLQEELKKLHSLITETIDLSKLKRTFSRFYGGNVIKLKVHNTVFAKLKVADLDPLASPGNKEFQDKLLDSVKKNGLKDPFTIHYVTNVPRGNRHGCMIKTGNNRYHVAKAVGVEEVECIVVNLSGECFGEENFNEPFIEGEIIRNEADVRKHFHTKTVQIVKRDGEIVNCYTPYFLRIHQEYDKSRVE